MEARPQGSAFEDNYVIEARPQGSAFEDNYVIEARPQGSAFEGNYGRLDFGPAVGQRHALLFGTAAFMTAAQALPRN
jgi:hypothetical protein